MADDNKKYRITLINKDGTIYKIIEPLDEKEWIIGSYTGNQISWDDPQTGKGNTYNGWWFVEEI